MSVIIVGSGPSGLYAALLLIQKGFKVCILEKQSIPSGKARTAYTPHGQYEYGPQVWHSHQHHFSTLVRQFHTHFKLVRNCPSEHLSSLPAMKSIEPEAQVKDVLKINDLRIGDEIADMNYYAWKRGYLRERSAQLRILPNGWQTLFNEISEYLVTNNVQIHFECKIKKVKQTDHGVDLFAHDGSVFHATNIILATSLENMPQLDLGEDGLPCFFDALKVARVKPTLRVYVEFTKSLPSNFPHDIFDPKSTFRWCIKINDFTLLICYVDGKQALRRFGVNKKQFIFKCLKELHLDLPIKHWHFSDWMHAFTLFVKPLSKIASSRMHQISLNIFQTFLPAPSEQAWTEGHLTQAWKCANDIDV
jgi:hypothetical protein